MQPVRAAIATVAGADVTVLVLGESGVGKELVAHALHRAPPRASHPFLQVNCAALGEDLLESELFGHEQGAITGACRGKPGKFELARRGTIFLDEIGEMPLRLQAKLLRVLQDGKFARVGGKRIVHSDVRVVAATSRDLQSAIEAGRFRGDLYYRLNVIAIRVPPLRDRPGEIPVLADHFLRRFNTAYGRSVAMSDATLRTFTDYAWPGNIRELENAVERMVLLGSAREAPRDMECVVIRATLDRVGWNRRRAARLLEMRYRTLLDKIGEHGLAGSPSEGARAGT